MAWLANETQLVDAFANGRDIYCEFASRAFEREVTKANKKERFVGKTCILGLGYGMGYLKLQATLSNGGVDMSEGGCKRLVNLYRNTYNRIPELWRRAEQLLPVIANDPTDEPTMKPFGPVIAMPGKIILPNGMPITYSDLHLSSDDGAWLAKCGNKPRYLWGGAVVENITQALARLIIARAELYLANRGFPAALQVHDELVYVVHDSQVERFTQALEMTLNRPVPWADGLPVDSEVKSGPNFADIKVQE